tara:strand:- start:510 stop:1229 length:720 start_codon:yes stop_codon:yes gene_type:complete
MSKCHASTPSTRTIARHTPSTSRAMLSSLAHGAHIAYRAHAPPSRCENARTRARSVALELNSGRLRRHLPGRRRETSVWARAGRENDDGNERNEQTQNEGDDRAHAVDWREFRARMVAQYSENAALGASIDAASRDGSPPTWAHGLENLEKGALLVAVEEDASSFWSHVVIFMLGEWFGRRALEKKEGGAEAETEAPTRISSTDFYARSRRCRSHTVRIYWDNFESHAIVDARQALPRG